MAQQDRQTDATPVDLRGCFPLARLRWIIRGYVLVEGVVLALILGCLWFWFSTALDFGLHHLYRIDLLDSAPLARWAIMTVFATAMTGIVVWYIFRRLFRDFNSRSLALVLEKRFPELLGDRLITAVELYDLKRAREQGYSVDMIVKTMQDAKERVAKVPVRTVFNWRRLALLAWTLVGVSVGLLLLSYPVCVLLSLIDRPVDRGTWMMLAVNGLIIACILFAFAIPYFFAGYRRASAGLRWVALGIALLCAGSAAVGYDYALHDVNEIALHDYSWRFYHASDIGTQRNLLFAQTRWPRDVYFIQWLDFPVDEKRVQVNKTLSARALFTTWIVADDSAPQRWRPLLWSDLPKVLGEKDVIASHIRGVRDYVEGMTKGDERSPVGYDRSKMALPDEKTLSVDLLLAALGNMTEDETWTADAQKAAAGDLTRRLRAVASDVRNGGRLVREVPAPGELTLSYGDDTSKLRGHSKLARLGGRSNVYGLEQPVQMDDKFASAPPQKEGEKPAGTPERKVKIVAEAVVDGATLATEPKNVVLVMAPRLQQIVYQEYRPAYYYYLPPTGPRAETIDERRALLKGLRQPLGKMPFASPADAFTLPEFTADSEIAFTAVSDKPLVEVTLTPRTVDFPGCVTKDDVAPVRLPVSADGRSFTVQFREKGKAMGDLLAAEAQEAVLHRVRDLCMGIPDAPPAAEPVFKLIGRPLTFDLTLRDIDNMTSTKSITVRPIEDKPPAVNLFVDVIRQEKINGGTVYICTNRAEVPFSPQSSIADEVGLHKIDFGYDYSPIVAPAYLGGMAEQVAWLFNAAPTMPNLGDYLVRREILVRNVPQIRTTIERDVPEAIRRAPTSGNILIEAFNNLQGRYSDKGVLSIDKLKEKLQQPLPSDYVNPILKKVTFKDLEAPITFDIERMLPQLREKNAANIVPNYKLTLDIRATDSNVQSDAARTARNAETLEFRVVSNDELYGYIAKEEAELVRAFGEMIQRLEDQQKVLQQTLVRVPSLSPSTASFEQTRLEGVLDALSTSRVTVAKIYGDYQRIQREYAANRFPEKLSGDLDKKIVSPMRDVQAKEFPAADRELSQFHELLKSGRPDVAQPAAATANQSFFELLEALRRIQKEMGDTIGFNKIVLRLQKIAEGQNLLSSDDLAKLKKDLERNLLHIQFLPAPPAVELDAGKSASVTLRVKMPTTITVDPVVRFEIPSNSGLKVAPAEVALKDDATEAKFTMAAGTAKGTYFVRVIPSQGDAIDLKVVVK